MRASFFLFLATVFLGTAEAGLRHIYENIYTYLVYQLELNLPENERIVGVKCASADYKTQRCLDPGNGAPRHKHCKGTVSIVVKGTTIPDTCSLREFLSHISGNKGSRANQPLDGADVKNWRNVPLLGRRVGENSVNFDIDYAADQMMDKRIGNMQAPTYCKVKDGQGYMSSLDRMAKRVGEIKRGMTADEIIDKKSLFKGLDTAADAVVDSRIVDSDKYLIPQLEKAAKGYRIATKSQFDGRMFMYRETVDRIRSSAAGMGESTVNSRIEALENEIKAFRNSREAKAHAAPIEKWRQMKDLMVRVPGCELRP
ncbi:uncharacterized protein UV8b_05325 [Ustilaginoidea virens]|uniref:Pesticin C-terminal domain-containing protein n=1 Tax=Ustilaginoidea virens TaxID=1159556 RepID=A0A063C8H8_USTVR|nr:uncharacterized protein UV8b_05325 [Ustilaginoidea virens]QUC21082.1 hypothetical protein UV8b_05325 [Ustilaginoidea virens]GAO14613.1 hypothetical protein UVI_02009350 [Ustilaginoidea virens]